MKTGTGSKYATDGNFLNKIADLANIDLDLAKNNGQIKVALMVLWLILRLH